jgi:hypothetical protein
MPVLFTRCAQIVAAGLVSAGLPCLWIDVVGKCRFTRERVVGVETLVVA